MEHLSYMDRLKEGLRHFNLLNAQIKDEFPDHYNAVNTYLGYVSKLLLSAAPPLLEHYQVDDRITYGRQETETFPTTSYTNGYQAHEYPAQYNSTMSNSPQMMVQSNGVDGQRELELHLGVDSIQAWRMKLLNNMDNLEAQKENIAPKALETHLQNVQYTPRVQIPLGPKYFAPSPTFQSQPGSSGLITRFANDTNPGTDQLQERNGNSALHGLNPTSTSMDPDNEIPWEVSEQPITPLQANLSSPSPTARVVSNTRAANTQSNRLRPYIPKILQRPSAATTQPPNSPTCQNHNSKPLVSSTFSRVPSSVALTESMDKALSNSGVTVSSNHVKSKTNNIVSSLQVEEKTESMAEKLAKQHAEEEMAKMLAEAERNAALLNAAPTKSIPSSWAGIAVKGVSEEEAKPINMRVQVPAPVEEPARTLTRIGRPKSKNAVRQEPAADQLRAVFILNPPENLTANDVSNGIHEGPLLAIRTGVNSDTNKRYFAIVFQWAPSATNFLTAIEEERVKSTPTRFGFIAHCVRGAPIPRDEFLIAMEDPQFARRRLTLAQKGLFFTWRKPDIERFCYKHVGKENVQFVHMYNGGNATICFTEIEASIKIKNLLCQMASSGQENRRFADLQVGYSKDPCEAEIRLVSGGSGFS